MPRPTSSLPVEHRHRCRPVVVAAVAAVAFVAVGQIPAGATRRAAAGGEAASTAVTRAARATAERERAEATYRDASARRSELESSLRAMDAAGTATTEALATARRQVRELAVAAYVDGGRTELLQASLQPEEAAAISWRVGMIGGGVGQVSESMERYESLAESGGVTRRAAAERLDRARSDESDASSALVQASAEERDARGAADAALEVEKAQRRPSAGPAPAGATTTSQRPPSTAVAASRGPALPNPAGLGVRRSGDASAAESAFLSRVRACESRGGYTVVSSTGRYRGAYQFSVETWRGVGGAGDPAAASPDEQDARALALLRLQGPRAWPVCGR